ncbi:MAG: tetratricopeptide repeat protein, partial [Anaerolineales bacterium]|nr:tetratricopeptide repeat protein [Anaerolineales bacterium]
VAGAVAVLGLLTALPVMVAGGVGYGLLTAVACAALLYLLWEHGWGNIVWPPVIIAFVSLTIGLIVGYLQANNLRGSLLLQSPTPLETLEQIVAFRVFEAERAAGFLTFFYAFMVLMLLGTAVALATPWLGRRLRQSGTTLGFGGLALLLIGGLLFNAVTNVRVVQADMVYKRARPFDNQGGSEGNSDAWNVAIAIYERALEMVPKEDFYYLFLGRAYLENSTVTADPVAREALLAEAETRLLQAQAINPLNTDHTANLARLNTRWYQLEDNEANRPLRLERARENYETALMLSPQNSIVRNEYAFLALELDKDCDEALAIYQQSADIDPYYASTYFSLADTYVSCAPGEGEARTTAYQSAADALELGLARDGSNPRAWAQAGQIYQEIGRPVDAIAAYEEAINRDRKGELPAWNMHYLLATAYAETGDKQQAKELGELARSLAPEAVVPEIEQFLAGIKN